MVRRLYDLPAVAVPGPSMPFVVAEHSADCRNGSRSPVPSLVPFVSIVSAVGVETIETRETSGTSGLTEARPQTLWKKSREVTSSTSFGKPGGSSKGVKARPPFSGCIRAPCGADSRSSASPDRPTIIRSPHDGSWQCGALGLSSTALNRSAKILHFASHLRLVAIERASDRESA